MEEEQRASQICVWLGMALLMALCFRDRLPTLEYGLDHFVSLESWYGISISFNLVFIFFMILSFIAIFLFDLDKILEDD